MIPSEPTQERLTRGECNIGDWVDATYIPDWKGKENEQNFRPESVVISPEHESIGGPVAAVHPVAWRFKPLLAGDRKMWRREE